MEKEKQGKGRKRGVEEAKYKNTAKSEGGKNLATSFTNTVAISAGM